MKGAVSLPRFSPFFFFTLYPSYPFSLFLLVPSLFFSGKRKKLEREREVLKEKVLQCDTTACCNTNMPEASVSKKDSILSTYAI